MLAKNYIGTFGGQSGAAEVILGLGVLKLVLEPSNQAEIKNFEKISNSCSMDLARTFFARTAHPGCDRFTRAVHPN